MNINKYYVVTDNDIFTFRNLKKLNNSLKTQFDINDFKRLGSDYILFCSDVDIVYQRDLHYLSQIPIQNLYRTDKRPLLFSILTFVFVLISLTREAFSGYLSTK